MLRVSPRTGADMTFLISARDRLERAAGLAAVLDAAYDAFESMRLAFRVHEDPASGLFGAFVMAAASAADGRDAVAFAPSLPAHLVRAHLRPAISAAVRALTMSRVLSPGWAGWQRTGSGKPPGQHASPVTRAP